MSRRTRVGLLLGLLCCAALAVAAGMLPEESAKALYDKSLETAQGKFESSMLRAYQVFKAQLEGFIEAAKTADEQERVTTLEQMLTETTRKLTGMGVATDQETEPLKSVPKVTSEVYAQKAFEKALTTAEAIRKSAVEKAYLALDGKIQGMLNVARQRNDTTKEGQLQQLLQDAQTQAKKMGVDAEAAVAAVATRNAPTAQQYQALMQAKCVSCHPKKCNSVSAAKQAKWIIPGNPDASPAFLYSKGGKKGQPCHVLPANEQKLIYAYIKAGAPE